MRKSVFTIAGLVLAMAAFVKADDPAVLKQRISDLEARVSRLEKPLYGPATQPVDQLAPVKKGDVLRVTVDDLTAAGAAAQRDVRVDMNGNISVLAIGKVKVADLKIDKVERDIVAAYLKANLIQSAVVSVWRTECAGDSKASIGTLSPGDVLQVTIMDLQGPGIETTKTVEVDEQYAIRLPYVGAVNVKDQTEADAPAVIAKAFRDANVESNAMVSVLRVATLAVPATQP